jgi:hypothetical protein
MTPAKYRTVCNLFLVMTANAGMHSLMVLPIGGQRIKPVEQKMKPRANESQSPETKGNNYESHVKRNYITGQQRQLLSPG